MYFKNEPTKPEEARIDLKADLARLNPEATLRLFIRCRGRENTYLANTEYVNISDVSHILMGGF